MNPIRAESLEVNEAEDGLVVYDSTSGMVHHLNATASVIFDLCDGTHDAEAIAHVVGEAFALEAPPLDETLAGLDDLAGRGLVRWDPR